MAKKQTPKAKDRGKGVQRQEVTTGDERDTRTAAERRREAEDLGQTADFQERLTDYQEEKRAKNRADFEESRSAEDEGEEVDNDRLPINHPTLMDGRDVRHGRLPPEATPREGKTSPAPPVTVPRTGAQRARARGERSEAVMVEATQIGYYGDTRRRPGDIFPIATPEDFSARWMRRASKGATPSTTTPNQAIRREHDAILAGRQGLTAGADPGAGANPLDAD